VRDRGAGHSPTGLRKIGRSADTLGRRAGERGRWRKGNLSEASMIRCFRGTSASSLTICRGDVRREGESTLQAMQIQATEIAEVSSLDHKGHGVR
jgi:hypothetical protein